MIRSYNFFSSGRRQTRAGCLAGMEAESKRLSRESVRNVFIVFFFNQKAFRIVKIASFVTLFS
jgi:hypothetical protein